MHIRASLDARSCIGAVRACRPSRARIRGPDILFSNLLRSESPLTFSSLEFVSREFISRESDVSSINLVYTNLETRVKIDPRSPFKFTRVFSPIRKREGRRGGGRKRDLSFRLDIRLRIRAFFRDKDREDRAN